MIHSLIRVQLVIREFFEDLPNNAPDIPKSLIDVKHFTVDREFWKNLEFVYNIISPINVAVKMSETTKAIVYYVIPRWKTILTTMKREIWGVKDYSEDRKQQIWGQVKAITNSRFRT
jgi:hypothetical protein